MRTGSIGTRKKAYVGKQACIGFLWKSKKNRKARKASRNSGSGKSETCKATSLERFFATKSRAYKHRLYNNWSKKTIRQNNAKDSRLTNWDRV